MHARFSYRKMCALEFLHFQTKPLLLRLDETALTLLPCEVTRGHLTSAPRNRNATPTLTVKGTFRYPTPFTMAQGNKHVLPPFSSPCGRPSPASCNTHGAACLSESSENNSHAHQCFLHRSTLLLCSCAILH